jgi:hypothetical protein
MKRGLCGGATLSLSLPFSGKKEAGNHDSAYYLKGLSHFRLLADVLAEVSIFYFLNCLFQR